MVSLMWLFLQSVPDKNLSKCKCITVSMFAKVSDSENLNNINLYLPLISYNLIIEYLQTFLNAKVS